ncbi:hypothetical protein J2Z37_001291 [Ammoniphilus resinae]|uniref:Uncharacterized protein n=2 Tax=Ammoniphilus resinae TaxID=861532 RepID=A0ABS4GM11_9BACL|nr:hypothetical protein [Ammoniphilus resinae]
MRSIENLERMLSDQSSLCERKKWKRWQIHRSNVIERFEYSREEAIRLARGILTSDPPFEAELIQQLFKFKDPMERYESLDTKMEKGKIDVLIVASPILVQEIAGIPALKQGQQSIVIYQRDSEKIIVLEQIKQGGDYLEDLTKGLLNGTIAIEDRVEDLVKTIKPLNLGSIRYWSDELYAWQAELSSLEVPYTVLASKITAGAIDKTLRWVNQALQEFRVISIENMKHLLYKHYGEIVDLLSISEIFRIIPFIERIEAKFSLPNRLVLSIESGIRLVEDDEIVRTGTKVSRTLVINPEGQDLYALLKESVSEHMAFSCFTNARGRDVYMAAIEKSTRFQPFIEQEKYDLSFLIGKDHWGNETFSKTSTYMLDSGTSGSIEMCRCTRYGDLIYGEMFLAHPHKGLNLTKYHPF